MRLRLSTAILATLLLSLVIVGCNGAESSPPGWSTDFHLIPFPDSRSNLFRDGIAYRDACSHFDTCSPHEEHS